MEDTPGASFTSEGNETTTEVSGRFGYLHRNNKKITPLHKNTKKNKFNKRIN